MSFDSLPFLVLLVVTFALFHLSRGEIRRWILLAASVAFYCAWKAPYFLLLVGSSILDYFVARRIAAARTPGARRAWLALSLTGNLSSLAWFKYANFLRDALHGVLPSMSALAEPWDIVLPVGISFYTFQTMSYSIDVWRGRLRPDAGFVDFLLYVTFFPQLVAGPIERAGHLLPQLRSGIGRVLDRESFFAGTALVIFGLFQKMVLADNLGRVVDGVFNAPQNFRALEQVLATVAFAFQIYFDFSAYSDIARGTARLFGVRLVRNFKLPYLADSPQEFWRRWHVSLSEWIRDYVYIPLGGGRGGALRTAFNLMVTMGLAGLWHGASWHFVAWGLYHGGLLVAWRLAAPAARKVFAFLPAAAAKALRTALVFALTCVGWILFRASGFLRARSMLATILELRPRDLAEMMGDPMRLAFVGLFAAFFACMSWQERRDPFRRLVSHPLGFGVLTGGLLFGMALLAAPDSPQFIYFQF